MDAILEQKPLFKRVLSAARTTLVWSGAILYPFVLFLSAQDGWRHPRTSWVFQSAVVLGLMAGVLRRRPVVALAIITVCAGLILASFHSWQIGYTQDLSVALAVGLVVACAKRWIAITASILALLAQTAMVFLYAGGGYEMNNAIAMVLLTNAVAVMIGYSVRERRRYAHTLREQAAAQAVTAERLRIARELHDIVAHSIGIIAIQAGVGARVIGTQPDEARNALSAIEATSRETLAGLRRMLGSLRRPEGNLAAGAPAEGVPLDPAPGLGDLGLLIATASEAGVRVELCWEGQQRPVPADIDLSAFRIIQEAVTNVIRHAGTHECRVTVGYRDDALAIEVADEGRGGTAEPPGYGITGMRERAALLNGRLTAGQRPGGGFQVTAELPVPVAVR